MKDVSGTRAEVDAAVGQRRVRGDKTAIAPHQLDQPHTVAGRYCLDVRTLDHLLCFGYGGLETQGRLTNAMSLSIVSGTPTTAIGSPRRAISPARA